MQETAQSLPATPLPAPITPDTQKESFMPPPNNTSKSSGGKKKLIFSILGVLVLTGGIAAGVLLVGQRQLFQQRAGVSSNINATLNVSQAALNSCASKCQDKTDGTCEVYVSRFKCDSNQTSGGCQSGGQTVYNTPAVGGQSNNIGFDTSRTCGTQQLDLGCRDQNGTYGNIDFLSYIGPNSCGGSGTTPTEPPSNVCQGDCFPNGSFPNPISNCGEVGRVPGSGQCSGGGLCCALTPVSPPDRTPLSCELKIVALGNEIDLGKSDNFKIRVVEKNKNAILERLELVSTDETVVKVKPDKIQGIDDRSEYTAKVVSKGPGEAKIKVTAVLKKCPACSTENVCKTMKKVFITDSTQPPTGINAQCLNIQAFDTEWNQLSFNDLTSLTAGDTVRFTAAGSASEGTFDKARFTINNTLRPETSELRPGTNEFFDEYVIPEGLETFTISVEIHHSTLGWF